MNYMDVLYSTADNYDNYHKNMIKNKDKNMIKNEEEYNDYYKDNDIGIPIVPNNTFYSDFKIAISLSIFLLYSNYSLVFFAISLLI